MADPNEQSNITKTAVTTLFEPFDIKCIPFSSRNASHFNTYGPDVNSWHGKLVLQTQPQYAAIPTLPNSAQLPGVLKSDPQLRVQQSNHLEHVEN